MKSWRESDGKPLLRILVLGATFFAVGLSPNVGMALIVLAAGVAAYVFLWMVSLYENRKK